MLKTIAIIGLLKNQFQRVVEQTKDLCHLVYLDKARVRVENKDFDEVILVTKFIDHNLQEELYRRRDRKKVHRLHGSTSAVVRRIKELVHD